MSLKVLVPVKRVIDYTVKVRVRPDKLGVEKKTVKMSLNPFCEIAVEEAVRMKEASRVSELIGVTIGPKESNKELRTAMAMGIDRAIHVQTEQNMEIDSQLQPLHVASILKSIVEKENINLVLLGKQAIDDDTNATAQMLAGKLNWPQATFASKISFLDDDWLEVLREVDTGGQLLKLKPPCVISADLRLNEPRFATLQNIMKAKKKKIEEISISDFNLTFPSQLEHQECNEPPVREGGFKVESVEDLFDKLREKQLI